MTQYDLVIFGATGFTGQWVAREFHEFSADFKWAICGRSEDRLVDVIKKHYLTTDYLVADVNDAESLNAVCRKTKLLVNCTGPYRLLGESIFKSCVQNGTDYLDICGEPEFIEAMEMKVSLTSFLNRCSAVQYFSSHMLFSTARIISF